MKWWHRPPPHIIQQTLGFGRDTNGTEFISICSSGQEEVEVYGVLFGFPLKFTLVSFLFEEERSCRLKAQEFINHFWLVGWMMGKRPIKTALFGNKKTLWKREQLLPKIKCDVSLNPRGIYWLGSSELFCLFHTASSCALSLCQVPFLIVYYELYTFWCCHVFWKNIMGKRLRKHNTMSTQRQGHTNKMPFKSSCSA